MSPNPGVAATYARVSREHQVGGESLDAQTAELLRFAEFRKLTVPEHLRFREEGVSGARAHRPALDQMLAAALRGEFEMLLVWKVSRFGRSARHNLELLHQLAGFRVGVHFVQDGLDTSTPANRALVIPILSGVAELESENIREQSMLGKLASARKGKWQGGEPPYGTRPVQAPDGRGKTLMEDPEEARALHQVWRWLVEDGLSMHEAARRLNTLDIPTRRGTPWKGRNLRQILRNPRLTGHATYGGIPVELPAIFTEDEHTALTVVLNRAAQRYGPKIDRALYPLSGLIVCGCGARWIGTRSDGQRYYRCQHNEPDAPQRCEWTNARWIRADHIEGTVWAELTRVLTDPTRLLAAARNHIEHEDTTPSPAQDDLDSARQRVEELEEARRRLLLDHSLRRISPEGVKDTLTGIEADLIKARTLSRDLEKRTRARSRGSNWAANLDSITLRARRWLTAANPRQQRQILDLLDIQIHLSDRDHYQITGSIPADDPDLYTTTVSPGRRRPG